MTKPDKTERLGVFDLNMACAYYACVFDAVIDGDAGDRRELQIGDKRYRLVQEAGRGDETDRAAPVADVDLSIARVATKGGEIVERADETGDGGRAGRVRDPFGHVWRVSAV